MEQLHPVAFHKGTARASEHLLACSGFSSGRKAGRKLGKALHTAAAISPSPLKKYSSHKELPATSLPLPPAPVCVWGITCCGLRHQNFYHQGHLCGSGKHQVLGLELELTESILWKLSQTITAVSPPNTLCSFTREQRLEDSSCLLKYRKDGSDHNLFFPLCYQSYQILIFRGFTQKISMNKICQP